jgi:predicted nucleic acid-binding protein
MTPEQRVEDARLNFRVAMAMGVERDARLNDLTDDEERQLLAAALASSEKVIAELTSALVRIEDETKRRQLPITHLINEIARAALNGQEPK